MKVIYSSVGTVENCEKCGRVFSTAIRNRRVCVKCHPVTKSELKDLMTGGGVTMGVPIG